MKKLLLSLFMLPAVGIYAAEGTKKPKQAGQFVNAATKSAVETVKAESTLLGKIDAFNTIPTKTHLAKLNPHISTLQEIFSVIKSPEQKNLEAALNNSQKTIAGLVALRKTARGASAAAIDDILAQVNAIIALAAEKNKNTQNAKLFDSAARTTEQSLRGMYLADAGVSQKQRKMKTAKTKMSKSAKASVKRAITK